jgi:hypothetical protein
MVEYVKPYPGGFRNRGDVGAPTPVSKEVLDNFQDGIAAVADVVTGVEEELEGRLSETSLAAAIAGVGDARYAPIVLEQDGVYPSRPDAPVVLFIGTSNPEALMEDADVWADPSSGAPLSVAGVASAATDSGSVLYAALAQAVGMQQAVWMPAASFSPDAGTAPSLGSNSSAAGGHGFPVWNLDPDVAEAVCATAIVPRGWNTARATIVWTQNIVAPSGSVRWRITCNMLVDGGLISDGTTTLPDTTTAAETTTDRVRFTTNNTHSMNVTSAGLLRITVSRRGDDVNDTLNGDAQLVGVILRRLT